MTCGDCERLSGLSCGSCHASGSLRHVVCMGDAPLANRLRDGRDDPVARHPQHLVRCAACGTVQLASRPPAAELFCEDYPYRSSESATMLSSAADLAEYLIGALQLAATDLVAEVGSNDGYLLRRYSARGIPVIGFDPARKAAQDAMAAGVKTETVFFDSSVGAQWAGQAAVVHASNVIAHVDDPDDVVAGIAAMLVPDGVVVIETPWLAAMIDAGAFDTVYHEHRFYWSALTLTDLLRRHGLHVSHASYLPDLHGGTLRVFATKRDAWSVECAHLAAVERRAGFGEERWAQRFEVIHRGQVEQLRRWWEPLEPVAGYGAAAKAAVLLHVLGVKAPLWVVDSTLTKRGRWTPSGSLVLAPDALEERMPADCVVFPWNFAPEIARKAIRYTERGGRLWTLIPHPQRLR